ncbi:MAG TPA: outer membrane beta-barrel protein [Sideroxyarcus sp.]|nr:outer membrane beta-barrel protein [Sideroxyarcus sp.]
MKMKKNIGAVVIAASMLVATSALAEGMKNELSVSANIDSSTTTTSPGNTSTSNSSNMVMVGLGQYLTPKFVLKENIFLMQAGSGNGKTDTIMVGAAAKYYFGLPAKSAWVPFAGGGINIVSTKSGGFSSSGIGIQAGGGVSYFVTEAVSGDIELQGYGNYTSGTVGNTTIDVTTTGAKLLIGTTVRF